MAGSLSLYVNEQKYTLQGLLKTMPNIFPLVATMYIPTEDFGIPDEEDIFLDKINNVQLLKIKVLPFVDEETVKNEKGKEFVTDRNKLIGEEFLIPANYPGKLRLVPRPGGRQRYTSIEQVIESVPRYVRVEETLQSSPSGSKPTLSVQAKTVLELKQIITPVDSRARYLKCIAAGREYEFKETSLVNMTAVSDTKRYTLQDIRDFVLFPTCVQFEPLSPDDVACSDDNEALKIHMIIGGPVELRHFQTTDLVLAWFKTVDNVSYKTVFANCTWTKQDVSSQRFTEEEVIKARFKAFRDEALIRKSLYAMPLNPSKKGQLTWLRLKEKHYIVLPDLPTDDKVPTNDKVPPPIPRRPIFPKLQNREANVMPFPAPPYEITEKESAKETKPQPPPCSVSKPNTSTEDQQIQLPTAAVKIKEDRLQKWKAKAKLGFEKVHIELFKHFTCKANVKNDRPAIVHMPQIPSQPRSTLFMNTTLTPNPSDKRPLSSLPSTVTIEDDDEESQHNYEDIDETEPDDVDSKLYDSAEEDSDDSYEVPLQDLKKISRENQTSEDFYNYSVSQVCDCFRMCKLEKMARQCKEQTLDGNFFKNFDFDVLKKEPFELDHFGILKVKKIILKGWRPLLC